MGLPSHLLMSSPWSPRKNQSSAHWVYPLLLAGGHWTLMLGPVTCTGATWELFFLTFLISSLNSSLVLNQSKDMSMHQAIYHTRIIPEPGAGSGWSSGEALPTLQALVELLPSFRLLHQLRTLSGSLAFPAQGRCFFLGALWAGFATSLCRGSPGLFLFLHLAKA